MSKWNKHENVYINSMVLSLTNCLFEVAYQNVTEMSVCVNREIDKLSFLNDFVETAWIWNYFS